MKKSICRNIVTLATLCFSASTLAQNLYFNESVSNSDDDQHLYAYVDGNAEMVLDDLIVYANPKEREKNSPVANSMVTRIWKSLGAGEGVGVNFDLSFAPNSSVLTADGNHLVDLIVRAIRTLDSSIKFEIQTHNKASEPLSRARLNSLIAEFTGHHQLKNTFVTSDFSRSWSPSIHEKIRSSAEKVNGARPDMWRVTIVNKGRDNNTLRSWLPKDLAAYRSKL